MTRGAGTEKERTTIPDGLALEAAEVLADRIAEGRPPPEVWAAAARRQAERGRVPGSWYSPAPPPPTGERQHVPLVLRVVRLPVPSPMPSLR